MIENKLLLDTLLILLILRLTHNTTTPYDPFLAKQTSFLHVLLLRLLDHTSREVDCALEGYILIYAFKSCNDDKQRESAVLAVLEGIFASVVEW